MVIFKSIIVLDLETTSLPQRDQNTTKIVELACIGCEVEHLMNSDELPRVLHKLVLLFNPYKMIHPEASQISGLCNDLLSNVKPMEVEDVNMLRQFINRLPPPVCIVAHNGNKFDFPILRRALDKLKMELQNNVYCADSILAFRSLLPNVPRKENNSTMTPPNQKCKPFNDLPHKKVVRELFSEKKETLSQEDVKKNVASTNNILKSYKLVDIYIFLFNGNFLNSHRAENDSKALLSCIMKCKGFFEWINKNAVIFNSIPPLC